ncbi:MAG: glycosyltransferase [Planctomycetaceae bacterium]|nr:glycosyltransferase [Planctomycetaceae bacterium]
MRITHVMPSVDSAYGGPVTSLCGFAEALQNAGAQNSVFAALSDAESVAPDVQRLADRGIRVVTLPHAVGGRRRHPRLRSELTALIRDADVVHLHGVWEQAHSVAAGLCERYEVPFVIRPCGMLSRYSLSRKPLKKWAYMQLVLRRILRKAALIHFTSEFEAIEAPSFLNAAKCVIEPLGVDFSEVASNAVPSLNPRIAFNIAEDERIITFVGRLHPVKGLDKLIDAMSELRHQGMKAKLLLCGPDENGYRSTLQKRVAQLSLQDSVIFTGMLDRDSVRSVMQHADVFVLPSRHENFGVSALEALSCGTPVVLSESVGVAGYLRDEGLARCFRGGHSDLARALRNVVEDPTDRDFSVSRIRRFAEQQFGWASIVGRWVGRYQKLCSGSRSALRETTSGRASAHTDISVVETGTVPPLRVLVVWSRVSGYITACWRQLAGYPDIDLRVVAWNTSASDNCTFDQAVVSGINCRTLNGAERADDGVLRSEVARFSPDVIVTAGWISSAARELVQNLDEDRPRIVMAMDTPWRNQLRQYLTRWRYAGLFRKADHVVVATERTWQYARRLGFREDEISRGVYGWDSTLFRSTSDSSPPLSPASRGFLFVGRLVAEKGIDQLIEAYQHYREQVSDPWPLTVCGTGPLDSLLKAPGVVHRGFLQPEQLPRVFKESAVLVLPSRYEPWGVVIAEAMGAGLPVIATEACGAALDLVRHLWNGLTVPTDNADRLSEALLWLHRNPQRLAAMGENARNSAEPYTAENWAERWRDVLLRVAGRPASETPQEPAAARSRAA